MFYSLFTLTFVFTAPLMATESERTAIIMGFARPTDTSFTHESARTHMKCTKERDQYYILILCPQLYATLSASKTHNDVKCACTITVGFTRLADTPFNAL
jgi:hypothetical protein